MHSSLNDGRRCHSFTRGSSRQSLCAGGRRSQHRSSAGGEKPTRHAKVPGHKRQRRLRCIFQKLEFLTFCLLQLASPPRVSRRERSASVQRVLTKRLEPQSEAGADRFTAVFAPEEKSERPLNYREVRERSFVAGGAGQSPASVAERSCLSVRPLFSSFLLLSALFNALCRRVSQTVVALSALQPRDWQQRQALWHPPSVRQIPTSPHKTGAWPCRRRQTFATRFQTLFCADAIASPSDLRRGVSNPPSQEPLLLLAAEKASQQPLSSSRSPSHLPSAFAFEGSPAAAAAATLSVYEQPWYVDLQRQMKELMIQQASTGYSPYVRGERLFTTQPVET